MSQVLNTNSGGAAGSSIATAGKSVISMTVKNLSGTCLNHETAIEASLDGGSTWFLAPETVLVGEGLVTTTAAATHARPCVVKAEGGTSTATINILIV